MYTRLLTISVLWTLVLSTNSLPSSSSNSDLPHLSQPSISHQSQSQSGGGSAQQPICQPVEIPLCKGLWYTRTRLPNMFNHESQEEAGLEAHQFWPLVQIRCSPDLQFFLCSLYAPICMEDYQHSLPPCRSMCERSQRGCAPILQQYGFTWPEQFQCSRFPRWGNAEGQLCMDHNSTGSPPEPSSAPSEGDPSAPAVTVTSSVTPTENDLFHQSPWMQKVNIQMFQHQSHPPPTKEDLQRLTGQYKQSVWKRLSTAQQQDPHLNVTCHCGCRKPGLISISEDNKPFYNKVRTGGLANCAQTCHSPYFNAKEQTFATVWLGVWSVLCLVCCIATLATFLLDRARFHYPERPIIFLSFCYLGLSAGFVLRVGVGHEAVACRSATVTNGGLAHSEEDRQAQLHQGASSSALCAIVFLLIYFFGMAASVWWLILTVTWFMASCLKWSSEAIAKYAELYHFLAWFLPSVQTLLALAFSAVDGDPISGICYIGHTNTLYMKLFVVVPLAVYLLLGTVFLVVGFLSMCRIRSSMKLQLNLDKLEKLMLRIGIFAFLYTVPGVAVLCCWLYEAHMRHTWEVGLVCECATQDGRQLPPPRPEYAVFMMKYFMVLVVGVTSGFWIWSNKTLLTWQRFFARIRRGCHSKESQSQVEAYYVDVPLPGGTSQHLREFTPTSYLLQGGGCSEPLTASASMVRRPLMMNPSATEHNLMQHNGGLGEVSRSCSTPLGVSLKLPQQELTPSNSLQLQLQQQAQAYPQHHHRSSSTPAGTNSLGSSQPSSSNTSNHQHFRPFGLPPRPV